MDIKVLKEEKDMMQVELGGEDHTFASLLKDELSQDDKVESAAYVVSHPLASSPVIVLRTKGKTPRKALKDAAAGIQKRADEFSAAFKNASK